METRHVKLDYFEALEAKKQLLTTELNLLQISKKIKNYRIIRKREQILKTKLRGSANQLKAKIIQIQATFPEEKKSTEPKLKREIPTKERDYKERDIQSQLEEIQKKLSEMQV
jgi:hypothetical protein